MSKRVALGVLVAILAAGACQERGDAVEPTGRMLFARHCAACHGTAGEGDGPLAGSLRRTPSDLTTIARRGGGRFDEAAVMATIDGRSAVAEHGPRDMPVWGVVFEDRYRSERYGSLTTLYHGRALTDYIRSIQQD